jgi:glycerol kinase
LTRGTTKAHIARAALEAIALQNVDLMTAMQADAGLPINHLRVDGGAAANDLLMQYQADVAKVTIERPAELESTARGAAMLAGVGAGLFGSATEAAQMSAAERVFRAEMSAADRDAHRARWTDAVRRARGA